MGLSQKIEKRVKIIKPLQSFNIICENSRLFNVHIHVFSWTEFQLGENYSNYIWPL